MLAAFLNLTDQTALVVGGGQVALRRAERLKGAQLRVVVVAPQVLPALLSVADAVYVRPFADADIVQATELALVVACTNDAALNGRVAALARGRGLLVNHAGNAQAGNLVFPAVCEQQGEGGQVTLAVHTAPSVPLLSQALCKAFSRRYATPWPVGQWAQRRAGALSLSAPQRQAAMLELKTEIEQVVM